MSNELPPKCPQCGAPLKESAPAGLCPNCLMALNLKTETVFTGDTPAAQPALPPEQLAPHFPQLEILECLGRGGMGVVYKARQKSLNRLVALKLLAPERVGDPKFAERFGREARALAALNHPNIVTIYDFGQAGGYFYLLMEFVDGANLRDLLSARKFAPEEALAIVPPLCDALQFAHDRGIVHRDIKPANLLLDKAGRVKIADFGIAKMLGAADGGGSAGEPPAPENATQSVVGTPGYSAPEQMTDPRRADSRADIYSLGVVFYEMLTGELPGKPIEPPSKKVHIDVRLDEVVLRALEKNPDLRYQQASVLKTRVETIATTPSSALGAVNAPWMQRGLDYRSKATLFGLPWLHVTSGLDPQTGRVRVARGIVAIGDRAQGVVAFGGAAMGGLVFGGTAVGVIAFGGCAVGLVSFGGLAIALIAAFGGGAIAPIAIGGWTMGYLALGGGGIGAHAFNSATQDPVAKHFLLPLAKGFLANIIWIFVPLILLTVGIGVGVPLWLQGRIANQPSGGSGREPGPPKPEETQRVFTSAATNAKRPRALALVAWVFIIGGLWSVFDMLPGNGSRNFSIAPTAFCLPIGVGLLRRREACRKLALGFIWAGFVCNLFLLAWIFGKAFGAFEGRELIVKILGRPFNPVAGASFTMLVFVAQVVLLPWIYWVVLRDEARAACAASQKKIRPLLEWGLVGIIVLIVFGGVRLPLQNHLQTGVYFTDHKNGMSLPGKSAILGPVVETVVEPRPASALQFRLVAPEATSNSVDILPSADNPGSPRQFRVLRGILLDGTAVAQAGITFEADGHRSMWIQFTQAGARQFEEITATNIDRQLALVYHGAVLSAPVITGRIPGGQVPIPDDLGLKEIHTIVDCLNRASKVTEESWTFNAPRERVLMTQAPPDFLCCWLDLDSGILATNNHVKWETRPGHEWISTNGFDLTAVSSPRLSVVIGFDIVIEPLPANGWDNTTPADVVQSWALMQTEPKQRITLVAAPGHPDTFLFQTREGGKGILQILGIIENGHGVKIRYKLAQNTDNPASANPIPPKITR